MFTSEHNNQMVVALHSHIEGGRKMADSSAPCGDMLRPILIPGVISPIRAGGQFYSLSNYANIFHSQQCDILNTRNNRENQTTAPLF